MKDRLRKKDIINLIKYHVEKNDIGFRNEAYEIAKYFDSVGDSQLSEYVLALLSDVNTFVPQGAGYDSPFLSKVKLNTGSLPLPTPIAENIVGLVNAVNHNVGINTFLFEGKPGTGKTESVKQVARMLDRDLFIVDFENIVDSKLGQTSKNIAAMFRELDNLPHPEKVVILFDEIDALALDRINSNDIREMGRVTSSVLKGLDGLNESIVLIATTNLYDKLDQALTRRFDATVNFNKYSREDLLDISETIAEEFLSKFSRLSRDRRLFRKIIDTMRDIPLPGDLRNIIKVAITFSNPANSQDYFVRLYKECNKTQGAIDLNILKSQGFTLREMEILSGVSKSQIARELTGGKHE